MLGALFALLAAATFAWTNAATRRGVLSGTVAQAVMLSIPIGVPVFLVALVLSGHPGILFELTPGFLLVFVIVGVGHFCVGRYCNYRAIAAIGTNLAGPIMQFNLVVSLGLAIFFLGETLTPLRIIGILLIVVGPMFVSRDRTRRSLTAPEDAEPDEARVLPPSVAAHGAFDPRFAEGYVFAFFASICYGATPPLVRYAVGGQGLTASIAGGVIATSAATLVAAVMLLLPRMRHDVRAVKLEAAKWFILSGVIVYISQIFAYMAVALAPVTITAPIIGLNNVFRIHVARLLNPHHEVFGPQVITATAVSFFGVVVLSIDPAVLPLPEQWIALLSWRWP